MNNKDLIEFATQDMDAPAIVNNSDVEVACNPTPDAADEQGNKKLNATMWAHSGRDYVPTEQAIEQLKPGQYSIVHNHNFGVYFTERDINLDDLLMLPDSNSEKVLEHIKNFWESEHIFREYGFLWKRGIMLWGPPGSGKTSCVQQISKQIIDNGGITVYCTNPEITSAGLDILRRIEPNRPLVVILEDIDAIIEQYGESDILALLDGELQVDNVVFIATTNYPGRLDNRFKNRPSRFDEIIKIPMPSTEAREYYLSHKNPRLDAEPHELKKWVENTKGFSVAHLKELIISVECFKNSPEDAISRLRCMMEATEDSYNIDDSKRKVGFLV